MGHTKYRAYVDGSFKNGCTGYGLIILLNNREVYRDCGRIEKYVESRQVAGELGAAVRVVRWCQINNIPVVEIRYDFHGVKWWATGYWKRKKPLTQEYYRYMQRQMNHIKINWRKVKAHSGNRWNDVADALAKQGTTQDI